MVAALQRHRFAQFEEQEVSDAEGQVTADLLQYADDLLKRVQPARVSCFGKHLPVLSSARWAKATSTACCVDVVSRTKSYTR